MNGKIINEKRRLDVIKFRRSLLEDCDNNLGFFKRIYFIKEL